MRIVAINLSRKKAYRKSKRILASVLPTITIRTHLGDMPRRAIWALVQKLRETANRGTRLQLFIEDRDGYHGWKCLEIGKHTNQVNPFVYGPSAMDNELVERGWLANPPPPKLKNPKKSIDKSST